MSNRMNLIDSIKDIRLGLLNCFEPEKTLDAIFMVDLKTNRIKHHILNYENSYVESLSAKKIYLINQMIEGIENKSFFNKIQSDVNEIDCTLFFYSDPQNRVDYCNIFFFSQNICLYETYNFSGETLLKGERAINKHLPCNKDAEFIKELYVKLNNQNLSVKKVVKSNKKNRYKSNIILFKDLITTEKITKLYHFTDKDNLKSIRDNKGLFSWKSCKNNKIEILKPGGDDLSRSLDTYNGLEDYVRLSYNRDHPMMHRALKDGRILNPVILEINPDVMLLETTQFSDMNANHNKCNVGCTFQDLKKVNFTIAKNGKYLELADHQKPYYQAEILVYSHIPLNYIFNINK